LSTGGSNGGKSGSLLLESGNSCGGSAGAVTLAVGAGDNNYGVNVGIAAGTT
jgi:hypothetical protein